MELNLHSVEEAEGTNREEPGTDDGHDPMGVTSTPSEPEKTDWNAESAEERWWQSLLRLDVACVIEFGFLVVLEVGEVGWNGNDCANRDTKEGGTLETEREAIDFDKDDWEGFEPDVQKTVDEGNVKVEQEHHGFLEVEGDRANKNHHDDILSGHGLSHQFRLTDQVLVSSQFP